MAPDVPGRPRRELTPAQHAQIRRQLALVPVYIWLVYGWASFVVQLPLGLGLSDTHTVRDFAHFYVQGVIANEQNAQALYDIDAHAAVMRRVLPGTEDLRFPPVYGPQISVLFGPLARLPYTAAMNLWLALTMLVYGACGFAFWKACPRLRDSAWTAFVLLLAAPALRFDLAFAQISAIGLACVTAGFFALRANRLFLAGLAIGSLAYKPQLGLAAAFVFLCAREWRIVFGAVIAAAAQLAIACLYWGPAILLSYAATLRRLPSVAAGMELHKFHMHSWRPFFDLLGLPAAVATGAYVAAAALTAVIALRCWRSRGPLAVRYSVLLLATVLVDPHLYVYDLIVLVPAFLLLWNWALEQDNRTVGDLLPSLPPAWLRRQSFSAAFQWLLYFCYMSPLFAVVAYVLHVQVSVLALGLLGLVLAGLLSSRSQQPVGELTPAFESDRLPLGSYGG
jgi:alpha-1,2-mannosyltransferase